MHTLIHTYPTLTFTPTCITPTYIHTCMRFSQAPPRNEEWDAETILSTYSTVDNHPTTIKVKRRPRAEQDHTNCILIYTLIYITD